MQLHRQLNLLDLIKQNHLTQGTDNLDLDLIHVMSQLERYARTPIVDRGSITLA